MKILIVLLVMEFSVSARADQYVFTCNCYDGGAGNTPISQVMVQGDTASQAIDMANGLCEALGASIPLVTDCGIKVFPGIIYSASMGCNCFNRSIGNMFLGQVYADGSSVNWAFSGIIGKCRDLGGDNYLGAELIGCNGTIYSK